MNPARQALRTLTLAGCLGGALFLQLALACSASKTYDDDTCPVTRPAQDSVCDGSGSCDYCGEQLQRKRDHDGGACAGSAFLTCSCGAGQWLCDQPR